MNNSNEISLGDQVKCKSSGTPNSGCPTDAATTESENMCRAKHYGFEFTVCTRLKGHEGLHHAHAGQGLCFEVW